MGTGDDAVRFARAQIGKPYVFGATGPNSFDCSGLVMRAYEAAGYHWGFRPVVHTILPLGIDVKKEDLQPGDCVSPSAAHIQIYSGNGKIIEAPHTGANVREIPMWGFWRGRRLLPVGTGANTGGSGVPIPNAPSDPAIQTASFGLGDISRTFKAYAKIAGALSDPHIWQRIGQGAGGGLLLIMGVVGMTKNKSALASAASVSKSVGKAAVKIAR